MPIIHEVGGNSFFEYVFHCPACGNAHGFRTAKHTIPPSDLTPELYQSFLQNKWGFNGDVEKPTITPSLHIWDDDGKGHRITKCHSFVTDGKIQYLGDCKHSFAGKTVDIPEF